MATTSSDPAVTYEQYMVPTLFGPYASRLVETANPQPGERVLDVACGTGIAARRSAPHVGRSGTVTGIDINPNMLSVADTAATEEGFDITWEQGRAEALPFPDASFDLALCQFGLMFFDDRQAALAEMRRVLVPEGRVVVSVWRGLDHHPFYRTLDAVIERHLGMSSVRDIFALGDSMDLQAALSDAGFREIAIETVPLVARFLSPGDFLAGEIDVDTAAIPAMQHLDGEARRDMVERIGADMAPALRDVTEGDHVVLPFHAIITIANC